MLLTCVLWYILAQMSFESKLFTDFYIGREFRNRRIAESAEPWPSLIKRLPKLPRGADTSHIQIAHDGQLIPFAAAQEVPGRLPYLSNQFHCEYTGGPKAGKGLFGKYIAYELARKKIGHVVYEERQPGITPETNLVSFNLCLQLLAAAAMVAEISNSISWEEDLRRRLKFWDRGIFNALAFEEVNDNYKNQMIGQSTIHEPRALTGQIVRSLGSFMDAVVIFHVDPKKSISRGSSVKEDYLELLAKSFRSLPEKIARSWTGNCGLSIIEIDANRRVRPCHDLALRSVGTLLQSMLNMHGTSEMLENMLLDE